jgi:type IV secretion system protein VirD4
MMRFYRNQPKLFGEVELSVIVALGVGLLGYVFTIGFGTRSSRKNEGVYGTAHWAKDEDEVRATGLLPENGKLGAGVYCGGWEDKHGRLHYLRHDGPEHLAAIAPTRSGKGLALVNTTLLSWPHSLVVNDQKGELWHLTAGWRKKHANNKVLKFDPASPEGSIAFNPLAECRVGTPYEVADVQNTVTIMVDPDGKGLADHWAKTSHALLTGLVLHLQYIAMKEGKDATLPEVAFALSDPARPVDALYAEMLKNTHLDGKTHPVVAAAARDMLNRPDDERGSVLSSAMSYLALYRDPLVAANVTRSDFKIMELMNSDTSVSLYLIVRAEDKDRLKPLMRLIINQLVRVLLRPELKYDNGRPVRPHKHRLLMMLDEFPSYGKLEVFQEALAYIAGYGIKAYLIMQDIAQLWSAYGRDETVISNCHVRIVYAPNKIETGEWLSKNCGTTTIIKEDISTSGHRFGAFLQNVNRAFHEVSRPLITPDEAMRLKAPKKNGGDEIIEPGEVIVLTAGHAPIKGIQSLYFRDPVFLERAKISPPVTDTLTRNGTTKPGKPATLVKGFEL